MTRTPRLSALFVLGFGALAPAQGTTWASLPPSYESFPGDAAMSLPARWSQGKLQVIYNPILVPDEILGKTLKRVRVRRPAFVAEPAYPARSLTFTLTLGIPSKFAGYMLTDLPSNRPATTTIVATSVAYSIPATLPHGAGDAVAANLVDLPFSTPYAYPATAQGLYVEWETAAPTLDISTAHWVDAVYSFASNDKGGVFALGNGGCGSSTVVSPPMQLLPGDTFLPALGTYSKLLLRGAKPTVDVWLRFGQEDTDTNLPPIGAGLVFGASMSGVGMPGCWFWSATQAITLRTTADATGQAEFKLLLPNLPGLRGQRLQAQAYARDSGLNALGLGSSNGIILMPDAIGVGSDCATVFCMGAGCTVSLWPSWVGSAPVLLFGY